MSILVIVLLVAVAVFAVQNVQVVSIKFLSGSVDLNLALVVLGSFIIGLITGGFWGWLKQIPLRKQIRDLEKATRAEGVKTDGEKAQ